MSRHGLFVPGVLALALAGVATAGTASAEPNPAPCSYRLSAPHVVQVSGVDMVSATLSPGPCTVPSNPNVMVACLQLAGSSGPGQCAQQRGTLTARVYYPYRPGSTYTATGRGCATAGNPPVQDCLAVGPTSATL